MSGAENPAKPNPQPLPQSSIRGSALERLWSHGMHEDNMFIQRGNFFLVAQSLLLVAYSGVLNNGSHLIHSGLAASRVIAGFGLAATMLWILTSYLHLSYVWHLRARLAANIPEYLETRTSWLQSQPRWTRGVDISVLIAYGVPVLAGVLWIMLLILV